MTADVDATPTGLTRDRGWEVGVRRTLDISPEAAWHLITGPSGLRLWLGDVSGFHPEVGAVFTTRDGTRISIVSVEIGSLLRMRWQAAHDQAESTLQIRVIDARGRATVSFHHEQLASEQDRERLHDRWTEVIAGLEAQGAASPLKSSTINRARGATMSAAIVHFEIHVTEIARAQEFYSAVFGWRIERWEGTDYYGVWTGRSKYPNGSVVGMDGGLRLREGEAPDAGAPLNSFLLTIEIEEIDATLAKISSTGGTVRTPKTALPGVGWQAVCADPDGNRFSLMQNDVDAE